MRTGMEIGLKTVALILASFHFLGYGWWDRSRLTLVENIFSLAPASALLIAAIIPFRSLYSVTAARWIVVILFVIASIRLVEGIVADWNSPIEPDTPAIALRLISLGILVASLWAVRGTNRRTTRSGGK